MSAPPQHSNLYIRFNGSEQLGEAEVLQVFGEFGSIASLRLVQGEVGQASHAFVKYELPSQVRHRPPRRPSSK